MPTVRGVLERLGNAVAAPLGYEIKRKGAYEKAEGFPGYYAQAQREGMDVNDWIETRLGWKPAQPILEQVLFPHLREDSIVCELGVGTGRWSRRILPRIPRGQLHLVDHSPWLGRFLQSYFRNEPRVRVYVNESSSLPLPGSGWVDAVFSDGTFLEFKLGIAYLFAQEFWRVLKAGGVAVFDYIDSTTDEGWDHMRREAAHLGYVYTYHAAGVMDHVFESVGFEVLGRHQVGKSTYLTVRKPADATA